MSGAREIWVDAFHATRIERGRTVSARAKPITVGDVRYVRGDLVDELKARVDGLCGYPLCDCGGDECQVLDGPIPDKPVREQMAARIRELELALQCIRISTGGAHHRAREVLERDTLK